MPTALYNKAQIKVIEQQAIAELQQDDFVLMQRAAAVLLQVIKQRWPSRRSILIYAGAGNNGGDGYLLAAFAKSEGFHVAIKCVGDHSQLPSAAAKAAQAARDAQVPLVPLEQPESADLLVDALLGIGLHRLVDGDYARAIALINQTGRPVLAVDVPSGLCADTGRVLGCAVKADLTQTFIGHKIGLLTADGPDHTGELQLDPLDIPAHVFQTVHAIASVVHGQSLLAGLPPRPRNFHKGKAGHVLIMGGDHGMAGASLLSAEAALRCGAGLVTVLTRQEHVSALLTRRPECMVHGVAAQQDLHPFFSKADVIVAGPGLGQQFWGQQLMAQVVKQHHPLLLDADALNILAQHRDWLPQAEEAAPVSSMTLPRALILTPHPAEAARLLQSSTAEVQHNRPGAVLQLQRQFQATILLKGNGSLVASSSHIQLLHAGNPGMASAGMGDVLTGIIAALWAQGMHASSATSLGAWLHATAADRLAKHYGQRGLLALDLLDEVRKLLHSSAG